TLAGLLLCFGVVVLGAYVRLTAAGLGCPDWPGCYGQATPLGAAHSAAAQAAYPSRPLDVGKAWREMIHRYAASTLGLIIVIIAGLLISRRRRPGIAFALALLATVIFQGVLGMLTVTWQLKPLIVTSHLVFGLTTLGLLWWLWLSFADAAHDGAPSRTGALQREPATAKQAMATQAMAPAAVAMVTTRAVTKATAEDATRVAWKLALVGLIALGVQIALGGWTSSNYAAISCPDFPTCQNEWWPATDYRDAFVLWRGLGIDYEGGIHDNPARVAIHLTHRLGALVATVSLLLAALAVLFRPVPARCRRFAGWLLAALALQLAIGISMVLRGFPLWLATAHTAGAALLLLTALALLRAIRMSPRTESA
ncbi:MAG TPA: COX15/CtaA family protein, partial [Steroidobacteraceae bacterium]|nr:COX15/CtaA family protein [Steroidobacteraceae bacterium]